MKFDPFEDRSCRDVRNGLGHAFVSAFKKKDEAPFSCQADLYSSRYPFPYIQNYIQHRRNCFKQIFTQSGLKQTSDDEDFWYICLLLWNLGLFFEFHEWLEEKWHQSRGDQKNACQALILCAVTYEQILYGRKEPAQKLGLKAVDMITRYRNDVPPCFNVDIMVTALTSLLPAPVFNTPAV